VDKSGDNYESTATVHGVSYALGQEVPIDGTVTYTCLPGFKFSETATNPGVVVTCLQTPATSGTFGWSYPNNDPITGGFGTCVDSVACNVITLGTGMNSDDFTGAQYNNDQNFTYVLYLLLFIY